MWSYCRMLRILWTEYVCYKRRGPKKNGEEPILQVKKRRLQYLGHIQGKIVGKRSEGEEYPGLETYENGPASRLPTYSMMIANLSHRDGT